MAEETKSRIRRGMTADGDQVLHIDDKYEILSDAMVDKLIHGLTVGKEESKQIRAALKIINSVIRPYNGKGKVLGEGDKLRVDEQRVESEKKGEQPNGDASDRLDGLNARIQQ